MKTKMKKTLFCVVMLLFAAVSNAQSSGDMGVGVNLNYGTGSDYNSFGLGAKYQYFFIDNLCVEANGNYFFKKDYIDMWDINANFQYHFNLGEKFSIYPLAGVGLVGIKVSADLGEGFNLSVSEKKFGVNVGAGVRWMVSSNISLNAEAKYQIVSDWNRTVITIGAAYNF